MVHNRNSNKSDNIELEIILVLIKGKSHLREIARTLKKPHATILRKLNDLVKMQVLDYKIEGRNKVFFIKNNLNSKNYVYSSEIYKLSRLIEKYPELGIILDDVKKSLPKLMIILFGSYAKGIAKQESDIDIYVETTNNSIKEKIKIINSKINVKIGKFDINSLLIKEIIKNHVILGGSEQFYEKSRFFEQN
ncbi:MAG: nucleotidyltransferase domain-containing protein [Patescibacteria group bacterium]